jgi:putative pyruvate formate lyase activating enzyme
MKDFKPAYLDTQKKGLLDEKIDSSYKLLESCVICPRKCKVNRIEGKVGFCKTASLARVCSYFLHSGEEPPISGGRGSGTIFFSYCNMNCCYCQNYKFSQLGEGEEVEVERLSQIMLELQEMKAHNINLVTPTHVMPQILRALSLAIPKGLNLPLVYNTSGYELPKMIELLSGVVDVYLADMRYADSNKSLKYSNARNYPEYNQAAIKKMFDQVGNLQVSDDNIALRGLIIRHLVLPNDVSGTYSMARFIAEELSKDVYVSLMSQYYPYYNAERFKDLNRRIYLEEYEKAKDILAEFGISNGWVQEEGGLEQLAGVYIKKNV